MAILQIEELALPFLLICLTISLVFGIVGYLYLFEHQQEIALPGTITVPFHFQIYIWIHVLCIQYIQHQLSEHRLGLVVLIATLLSLFYPYLRKASPFLTYSNSCVRCWDEKLITTSYLYLMGAVSNIYFGYYQFAVLCVLTSMGSVLYHRHREGKFFNLDNIFATSHVFLFAYVWYHAWHADLLFFLLGSGSLPIAVFLLVYCGDPADILQTASGLPVTSETLAMFQAMAKSSSVHKSNTLLSSARKAAKLNNSHTTPNVNHNSSSKQDNHNNSSSNDDVTDSLVQGIQSINATINSSATVSSGKTNVIQRVSRSIYDQWHTYWHVVSAMGPVLVSFYLHTHGLLSDSQVDMHINETNALDMALFSSPKMYHQAEMTMIVLAITASVTLNILANITGAVPFN